MGSDPTAVAGTPGFRRYCFGGILVDAGAHSLRRDGHDQGLEPKAFAVLLELLAHAGELVGRDQLLDAIWGHRHVTPGVLTRAIAQLRAAMGDDPHHPRFIQTLHGLGYRFIGELEPEPGPAGQPAAAEPPPAAALPPESSAPATSPLEKHERRSADRLAHHRWVLLACLLAALLVLALGAMLSHPAPETPPPAARPTPF